MIANANTTTLTNIDHQNCIRDVNIDPIPEPGLSLVRTISTAHDPSHQDNSRPSTSLDSGYSSDEPNPDLLENEEVVRAKMILEWVALNPKAEMKVLLSAQPYHGDDINLILGVSQSLPRLGTSNYEESIKSLSKMTTLLKGIASIHDEEGSSIIHVAAKEKDVTFLQFLSKCRVNLNTPEHDTIDSSRPIHIIAERWELEAMDKLMGSIGAKIDINAQDGLDATALTRAVVANPPRDDIIRFLWSNGARFPPTGQPVIPDSPHQTRILRLIESLRSPLSTRALTTERRVSMVPNQTPSPLVTGRRGSALFRPSTWSSTRVLGSRSS
jgi:hypothetical protein